MIMSAAGRLTAMVSAGAGAGLAELRPRPRSRFHPPSPGTAPALTAWDDLAGDGSPATLADDGNGLGGEASALTAGDAGPRSTDAGRPSGRSPRRANRSGRAAGVSGDDPLARRVAAAGPGPDDTGVAESQLSRAHPGSAAGRRAGRQLAPDSENLAQERISTFGGLADRPGRPTRGTRVDDMSHEDHPVPGAMNGTEILTDPGAVDHHAGPDARPRRAARLSPHPGSFEQAMDAGSTESEGDDGEGAGWEDGTPPVGVLRPRITGTAASGVRGRPADGAATEGARGEREVTVQVSIGRIEVRVAPEPPATRGGRLGDSPPAIRPGLVTLEEYGARREARR
jgi:hypothetical protein